MKRLRKIIICACFFVVSLLIVGCSSANLIEIVKTNLSEIRNNLFVGQTDNLIVSVSTGEREKDYKLDGRHTENIEFCLLTCIVLNNKEFKKCRTYSAEINGQTYVGEFEVNPYDNSLVVDLGFKLNESANILVSVNLDEVNESTKLKNISTSWNISGFDALEIATKKLKKELKTYILGSEFNMEAYLKILYDFDNLQNPYYWFISFIGNDDKQFSIVIDVNSGEIITAKIG